MYEELVNALRCYAKDEECYRCEYFSEAGCDIDRMLFDAADAIERMNKALEDAKEYESFWEEEANEALRKFQVAVANKPRWIPVTERLPEKFKDVLTYGKYGIMVDKYIGQFCGEDSFALALRNVTHWMPLPEPPMEETE